MPRPTRTSIHCTILHGLGREYRVVSYPREYHIITRIFCKAQPHPQHRMICSVVTSWPNSRLVPPMDESMRGDWSLFFVQCHKIAIGLFHFEDVCTFFRGHVVNFSNKNIFILYSEVIFKQTLNPLHLWRFLYIAACRNVKALPTFRTILLP
jgi:hypothetical protein